MSLHPPVNRLLLLPALGLALVAALGTGRLLSADDAQACETTEGGAHSIQAVRRDAMSRYEADDFGVFVDLMEAVAANSNDDVDDYNLACGYALLGRPEAAIAKLRYLLDRGASFDFEHDSDFDALRDRPDYKALVAEVRFREEANARLEPVRKMAWGYYTSGDYPAYVRVMEQVAHYSGNNKDLYNLACGYALAGQREKALDQLAVLAERGADYGAASDEDFTPLRDDPRFQALLVELDRHAG